MARVKFPSNCCKTLKIPIYGQVIYFFDNLDSWNAVREWFGHDPYEPGSVGISSWYRHKDTGKKYYALGVFDGDLGTLVHESVHVATDMCEDLGIQFSGEQNEPIAYLIDYIFTNLRKYVEQPEKDA